MKRSWLQALIAGAAGSLLLLAASPAGAQHERLWTHPGGAYQLDVGLVDWKVGSAFSYNGKQALVTFRPNSWDRLQGSCVIFESRVNISPETGQAGFNDKIAAYTAHDWATAMGYDPALVREFRNEMVGNVRVATMVVDNKTSKPLRAYYRSFIIAKPGGAFHQELSCSISPNASTSHIKDVVQFLDSLRFPSIATNS